jgi:trk system potassium uptake protein TrkH
MLSLLIGASMVLSLPWSYPMFGQTATIETTALRGMLIAILACAAVAGILIFVGRKPNGTVLRKEALAVVGLGWIVCGFLGGLPYLMTPTYRLPGVPMSVADSVFESVSGFTTTGASVLTQLEVPDDVEDCEVAALAGEIAYVPRCVLFWRSFTHWLGGMGIIVLFVAILGHLGAGGKALMRREVPGPVSDTVRPRIRETAVVMWSIYLALTVVMTIVLMIQGMNLFESLCHTFGTLATGGFSTRNASVGSFQDPWIEFTIIVFMIAAGTNFNLYYLLLKRDISAQQQGWWHRIKLFFSDAELRFYLLILTIASAAITCSLVLSEVYPTTMTSIRHATFNVVAVMTTTGFGTEDFAIWPYFCRTGLLLLMFVGGCSGSTGGGIKVIRFLILTKVLLLEGERAFRPNLVRPVRLAGGIVPDSMGRDVLVYFCLIGIIFASSLMLLVTIEPSTQWDGHAGGSTAKLSDCAGAVAATLNNIGPGLGVCGPHGNYTAFSEASKFLLSVLMLLGRLELFAILVLLIPGFWRLH